MFTLFKTRSYNLTLISSLFADGIQTHLSRKSFYPNDIPFPLVHIDTGHNFPETIEFRNNLVDSLNVQLIVGSVQKSIDCGRVSEEKGSYSSRNKLQPTDLLDTIDEYKIDCAIGGGRRDVIK